MLSRGHELGQLLDKTNIQTSEVKTKRENPSYKYKPEGYEMMKSKNLRLANVKSANIASSDGGGDLVGEGQTRRNTAAKGNPNHVGDPERQVQW